MSFRASLEPEAVRHVHGLPGEVLDELIRLMARICEDPFDAVLSVPAARGDPYRRMAEIGDGRGFAEFKVDEQAWVVRVYAVAWTG
jgi:hypothetical protein